MLCVYVHFYDTVYKRNILNAAEKCLILREHFTMKIWTSFPLPTTASVMLVRSVKMVVKCAARVNAAWRGWPTPLEVSKSRKSVSVAYCYLTSHWRPAYSARTRHAADTSCETYLTPKADGWNDCKQLSVDWCYWFRSLALFSIPSEKGKVHVERHLHTVLCSVYTSQSLERQTNPARLQQ